MRDAASVITQTTVKIADKLAVDLEVSLPRMYEILGRDNPYPKAKRLIRAIARHNPYGAALIKADLDAMFAQIAWPDRATVTVGDLHKEAFEAVDAMLNHKSKADQQKELRDLIAVAQMKLELLDVLDNEQIA